MTRVFVVSYSAHKERIPYYFIVVVFLRVSRLRLRSTRTPPMRQTGGVRCLLTTVVSWSLRDLSHQSHIQCER